MRSLVPLWLIAVAGLCHGATYPSISIGGPANVSLARISVDSAGNIYVVGTQLVTAGTYAAHSIFVGKFDPSGTPIYTTRFGGKGEDLPTALAVDQNGRLYCGGSTTSADFPLLHPVQNSLALESPTAFVFALDENGVPAWSTYFGGVAAQQHGPAGSSIGALTVDAGGNVYVAGTSYSPDLLTTAGAFQPSANFFSVTPLIGNQFVAKFSTTGQLRYATWLSGSSLNCHTQVCGFHGPRIDAATAIAVDSLGSAYIFGYTDSADFPTTAGAYQTKNFGSGLFQTYDAFLSKLAPDGGSLVYSTFLGTLGHGQNMPQPGTNHALALDSSGNATVAFGTTGPWAEDFGGVLTTPVVPSYVQVMTVNATGTGLNLSTTLKSDRDRHVKSMAVRGGTLYFTGLAGTGEILTSLSVMPDLKAESSLQFPLGTAAEGVALAPDGTILAMGSSSRIFRLDAIAAGSLPLVFGAGNAATWTVDPAFTSGELVSLYGSSLGPSVPVTAVPDVSNPLIPRFPTTLGGFQIRVNGQLCPLLYVSPAQINFVMPALDSSPANVTISGFGFTSGPIRLGAASEVATPGIFQNLDGTGAVLNQDGTLNSKSNPARTGEVISLWGNGISTNLSEVRMITQGGSFSLPVLYAGPAPGLVAGVFQINTKTPLQPLSGPLAIQVAAGGVLSPPVTIFVAP